MTDKRKSPYLVLGLPIGAPKADAAKAFARATRRLRRLSEPPFDLEDLNWALHAIEHRADDPGASIDDYRMPADPAAHEPAVSGRGLLAPAQEGAAQALRAGVVQAVVAARMDKDVQAGWLPVIHRYTEKGQ